MTKGLPRSEAYRTDRCVRASSGIESPRRNPSGFQRACHAGVVEERTQKSANEAPDSSEDHLVTAVD